MATAWAAVAQVVPVEMGEVQWPIKISGTASIYHRVTQAAIGAWLLWVPIVVGFVFVSFVLWRLCKRRV